MKKIYFRILAICLSLILSFTILYKDSIQADALEWVGVAVGYDTAFKFLLGLLGVSVGVGVAQEVDWGTLRENAIQVQLDQGNSQAEVSKWWTDVIHGSIDTASNCWASFKTYVKDLTTPTTVGTNVVRSAISSVDGTFPLSTLNSSILDFNFNIGIYFTSNWGDYYKFYFFNNAKVQSFSSSSIIIRPLSGTEFSYCEVYYRISDSALQNNPSIISADYFNTGFAAQGLRDFHIYGVDTYPSNFTYWNLVDSGSITTSPLEALYPNIGDIALNPENADTLATDVIPLPWENIGASDTDIEGIIDDAISRVIDGTLSLENYWEYVQNITNTYAYSIENNYLLPNENGEDKKADDKVKENAENGAFVLYGLEKVFPFCIPFDIYAFITLLEADPVAPIIEYPIYNPVTQENEIITIDFSEWESVVIIFRYIFDFLLIIGLLLLARPLVGAGGDS